MPDDRNFGWNQGWLLAVMGEGEKASQEMEGEAHSHKERKYQKRHIRDSGSMNCQTEVRVVRCNTRAPGQQKKPDVQNPRAEVSKTHSRNSRSDTRTFNGGNAEPPPRTAPPVRNSTLLGTTRKGLGGRVPRCATLTGRVTALCRALTCSRVLSASAAKEARKVPCGRSEHANVNYRVTSKSCARAKHGASR